VIVLLNIQANLRTAKSEKHEVYQECYIHEQEYKQIFLIIFLLCQLEHHFQRIKIEIYLAALNI